MIHDGIRCRRSRVFGWRYGNPETDVNCDGRPVPSNYIVIVWIKDCPVEAMAADWEYYKPEGVKQAFPISHGGTNYGYAKSKIVRNGPGRRVWVYRNDGKSGYEWLRTYGKTPIYVVRDGEVYVGAVYRELVKTPIYVEGDRACSRELKEGEK